MPIVSEHFKKLTWKTDEAKGILGTGGSFSKIETDDLHSLREWWYTILRNYGKYPCYAIFLVLSSDKEVAEYLREIRTELNVISGSDCLIIILGNNFFFTSGLKNEDLCSDDFMVSAINNHIESGESVQVAKLFDIEFTQFPCILFFDNIRSSKFAVVSLKEVEGNNLNQTLREVFSIIHRQVKEDPNYIIDAISKYYNTQKVSMKKQKVMQVVTAFIGKTIETIMNAWVKSIIK